MSEVFGESEVFADKFIKRFEKEIEDVRNWMYEYQEKVLCQYLCVSPDYDEFYPNLTPYPELRPYISCIKDEIYLSAIPWELTQKILNLKNAIEWAIMEGEMTEEQVKSVKYI